MCSDFPKIAVLLAAYNGMSWIEEQLTSILGQVKVSVSVYISVDPSSDGTEAWCAEFALAHPNVHLLLRSGPFKGAARNFFRLIRDVDFSAYDFVSFSDQDDIWYPDKLARAVATLCSTDIDGYSSNVVAFWPNGRRMLVDKAQPQVRWDYLFEAAGPGCTYVLRPGLAAAFKQLLVNNWNKVQDVALHDWLCYAFARSHGFKWFIDSVPGMDYRQHANNQVGVNSGIASAFSRIKLAGGWWMTQIDLTGTLTGSSWTTVVGRPQLAGRVSYAMLAAKARQCRRRPRDQIFFALIFISLAIFSRCSKAS